MSSSRLAIILAMAVAIGPFAFDTYLPAFPSIASALQTDISKVGFSISVYIFSLAFGQLIGGPLSDHWGRARIMLIGLGLFAVSSVMLAFSQTLSGLIVWRIVQAFGGGWSAVSVPAIVRDRTEGPESAKLFSLIALMMIVAPALAPTIGSIILTVASWRGIFIFLACYSVLVMVMLRLTVFASPAPPHKAPATKLSFLSQYRLVLQNKVAIYLILLQAFSFCILMIFLTNASFIYQAWFGLPKFTFAFLVTCNIAMMALLSITNRILLRWLSSLSMLFFAVMLQTLAVLALAWVAFFHDRELVYFVPALMVSIGSMGIISPNNQACYLQFFKQNSGTAAALMGALQLTVAGCMSGLSAFMGDGTLRPIVLTMVVCSMLSVICVCKARVIIKRLTPSPLQEN